MNRTILTALALLCAVAAGAQTVGDDFDDDARDASRWGLDEIDGNGVFTETNQRLEYTVLSPSAMEDVARPWTFGAGPYDASWEVQIDLFNATTPGQAIQNDSFGITVVSSKDDTDEFFAEMYASTLVSPPLRRGFHAELHADDVLVDPFADTLHPDGNAGAVRIAFDATMKVLTAYYDVDPSDGYQWTQLASYGVAGSGGLDGNADFGMSDADQFLVRVYGYSTAMLVASGQMYGDNFQTTGFRPLAPGIELTNTDNDHLWTNDPLIPYQLTVTNHGDARSGLVLREIVPVNTVFSPADSTPGWTCTPGPEAEGECTLPIGDLASGASVTTTFATRVVDGTDPGFDIFNEASTNPTTYEYTAPGLCDHFQIDDAQCCAIRLLFHFGCISATCGVMPAGLASEDSIDLFLYYRVRDRVFHRSAGGRRVTQLYYAHQRDLLAAAVASRDVDDMARPALLAWQPGLRALVEGAGASVVITPAQVEALTAFLDALAPVATPALRAALERERALLGVDTWAGKTMEQALAELERASCDPSATYASVRCRFEQLSTLVARLVPAGRVAKRLTAAAAKGKRHAEAAERLVGRGKARPARSALRKAIKALTGLERRLRSAKVQRIVPEAARGLLQGESSTLRADVATLRG